VNAERGPILVVDDHEPARYARSRILRRAGFEVLETDRGSDALQLIGAHKPRLVILDINLPDIDGWEVCRRIKADPATASTVVLQVSATYVREEDLARALEGGADAALVEPVDPTVLIATVKALLRARLAEDALRVALDREQAARTVAEAANRAKDEFLAVLSHELRSPLNAIVTWVTLLRSRSGDAGLVARGLEAIERSARLQASLVAELLDVSRIVSGKMELDVGAVDLTGVIGAALNVVRPEARARSIRISAWVDPKLRPIRGDGGRLQQVIGNLLTNSIKFTPEGGRIEIRAEHSGPWAEIRVSDNGRGIEKELLPHVFERFRQGDSSTTRAQMGLGLGLAIVRHLVEMHGGSVRADSPGIGQGSTFTVRLPLSPPGSLTAPEQAPVEESEPNRAPRLDDLRILVVDDERDSRDAVLEILSGAGATVSAASSARAAVEILERDAIDVLVSDLAMPVQDGFSLIQEIRGARSQSRRQLRALALTAFATAEHRRRALAAGYDAFLAKPIEAAALVAAVAHLASR
jgi:signal transduction histidine kinase